MKFIPDQECKCIFDMCWRNWKIISCSCRRSSSDEQWDDWIESRVDDDTCEGVYKNQWHGIADKCVAQKSTAGKCEGIEYSKISHLWSSHVVSDHRENKCIFKFSNIALHCILLICWDDCRNAFRNFHMHKNAISTSAVCSQCENEYEITLYFLTAFYMRIHMHNIFCFYLVAFCITKKKSIYFFSWRRVMET